jgi:hypothetical protein
MMVGALRASVIILGVIPINTLCMGLITEKCEMQPPPGVLLDG